MVITKKIKKVTLSDEGWKKEKNLSSYLLFIIIIITIILNNKL